MARGQEQGTAQPGGLGKIERRWRKKKRIERVRVKYVCIGGGSCYSSSSSISSRVAGTLWQLLRGERVAGDVMGGGMAVWISHQLLLIHPLVSLSRSPGPCNFRQRLGGLSGVGGPGGVHDY